MPTTTCGYLCQARSSNIKTGDVPQIAIGTTRAESITSCQAAECAFLATKHGGKGGTFRKDGAQIPLCYAQYGTPALAHSAMIRSAANGKDKTLRAAFMGSVRSARMLRLGSIGDPGSLSVADGKYIRDMADTMRVKLIGYIHGWTRTTDETQQWRGQIMASCDTLTEADEAIKAGWRPAVVLPRGYDKPTFTTPGGTTGRVCKAQLPKSRATCNTCLMCDGDPTKPPVGFIDHSKTGPRTCTK